MTNTADATIMYLRHRLRSPKRRGRTKSSSLIGTGCGNPGGSPEATRRAFNKRFLLDLAEDWQQYGREVFKRVRRESPAAYLKVCAMLVPKEMKVEHSSGLKDLTDEQLDAMIEHFKALEAQAQSAKVIEGEAEVVQSLPAPARPTKAS